MEKETWFEKIAKKIRKRKGYKEEMKKLDEEEDRILKLVEKIGDKTFDRLRH